MSYKLDEIGVFFSQCTFWQTHKKLHICWCIIHSHLWVFLGLVLANRFLKRKWQIQFCRRHLHLHYIYGEFWPELTMPVFVGRRFLGQQIYMLLYCKPTNWEEEILWLSKLLATLNLDINVKFLFHVHLWRNKCLGLLCPITDHSIRDTSNNMDLSNYIIYFKNMRYIYIYIYIKNESYMI